MICPYCKTDNNIILDTRSITNGTKRRRKCLKCNNRFSTFEYCSIAKKGRPMKTPVCAYCGKELNGWGYYYRPEQKWFCEGGLDDDSDGICLKNYLFKKFQSDIKMDAIESDEQWEMAEKCREY